MVSTVNSEIMELIDQFVQISYSTEASRIVVKHYLKWFIRYLKQRSIDDISMVTPQDIVKFRYWLSQVQSRRGKKLSNRTINQILSFTKAFFEFLEALGYSNPFNELPTKILKRLRPREKRDKVPEEYTGEQLRKIFNYLKHNADEDVYLACLIAYATGARLNEVLNICAEDVIIENDVMYIIIRKGKGLKERISIVGCPGQDPILKELNAEAKRMLKKRVKERKRGYLFGNNDDRRRLRMRLQQCLYRLSKKLGFRVHIHAFRSNWGTKALNQGIPLEIISRQLGHAHTQTTEIFYAQLKAKRVLEMLKKYVS